MELDRCRAGWSLVAALALLLGTCSWSSEDAPHTGPAEVGVEAELIVSSDCGIDNMVFDHDGSLWNPTVIKDSERQGTPEGFESDNDVGTIVLISEDEAEYRSSHGRVVKPSRLPGHLVITDC